jgi:hypothetical protein
MITETTEARLVCVDPASGTSIATGDASALVVLDCVRRREAVNQELERQRAFERDGCLRDVPAMRTVGWQQHVTYIERLAGSFVTQAERIAAIMRDPAVATPGMTVHGLIDATGLGAPVADEVERHGVRLQRIVWTAGAEATAIGGAGAIGLPKSHAYGALMIALDRGELKVAGAVPERDALLEELRSLQLITSEQTGHQTVRGASGSHDDLASALAAGVWIAQQLGRQLTAPGDWMGVAVPGWLARSNY